MSAVFKREIKKYYTSPVTYIYYFFFFLACGILFSVYCLANYNTQFGYYVLSKAFYICVLMIPLFTMQMFARERQIKTDQLLFTSPVPGYAIVVAKYLSTVLVVALPVLLSLIYPVIIMNHGEINVDFMVCSYIAVCLLILVLVAIGMFMSTITSNPVLAAILLYFFYVLLILLRVFEALAGQNILYDFLHDISLYDIYLDMVSGIVRSGNVVFVIVLTLLFVNLAWLKITYNRLSSGKRITGLALMIILSMFVSFIFNINSVTMDFTPEKILTLSNDTIDILNSVRKKTQIYYIGRISNANATYQEFLKKYENQNDNISVEYVDLNENRTLHTQYMSGVTRINEASLLVVCEDEYIYLDSDDYITTKQESDYEYHSLLEIESQLTEAIYYTNNTEKKKIYMLSSNQEYEFTERMVNKIKRKGYDIELLYIKDKITSIEPDVPEDCDVLIMNSPEEDYSDDEVDALTEYVDEGGKLIVFLDPLNEELPKLYSFLEDYGLSVESGIVIEQDESMYADETPYYLAPQISEHDITKSVLDSNLHVYTMTSKGIDIDESNSNESRTDILMTSRRAFAKKSDYDNISDKGDEDVGGPFSIASLVERNNGELLLVTSNIFLNDDADKDSLGADSKFLIGMLDYMSNKKQWINIAGKNVKYNVALYQTDYVKRIRIIFIVVIPLLILILGIAVVIIRSKNILINHRQIKMKG